MAPTPMSKTQTKGGLVAASAKPAISLAPSTFTTGGGLLDDADVSIKDAAFLMWDYDGKVSVESPALGITFLDADDKEHDQYFSAGKSEHFIPNEDGTGLIPVGDKTAITNNCNTALFLASLVSVGVPEDLLASGNIKDLVGMKLHVNRIPAPERKGLDQPSDKKKEVLVATKLLGLPGEAAAAAPVKQGLSKTTTAKVAAAPPAPALAADEDLIAETVNAVVAVLGENNGTVARKSISPKVFANAKGNPRQAEMMKLAFTEDFLQTAGDGMWTYDGVNIALAG